MILFLTCSFISTSSCRLGLIVRIRHHRSRSFLLLGSYSLIQDRPCCPKHITSSKFRYLLHMLSMLGLFHRDFFLYSTILSRVIYFSKFYLIVQDMGNLPDYLDEDFWLPHPDKTVFHSTTLSEIHLFAQALSLRPGLRSSCIYHLLVILRSILKTWFKLK